MEIGKSLGRENNYITLHYITLHYITLHYITLSAFQTPPTHKVTSGASTITWYTKYSPVKRCVLSFERPIGNGSSRSSLLDTSEFAKPVAAERK